MLSMCHLITWHSRWHFEGVSIVSHFWRCPYPSPSLPSEICNYKLWLSRCQISWRSNTFNFMHAMDANAKHFWAIVIKKIVVLKIKRMGLHCIVCMHHGPLNVTPGLKIRACFLYVLLPKKFIIYKCVFHVNCLMSHNTSLEWEDITKLPTF